MTRVLVVDDEPQILRAMRVNLTARNYEVIAATTGRQALDAAARGHPDIVVLDLGLPDMDGVEVIEALRGWTTTPIIILSGRAQSAWKIHALDAGADDYVTKPFNIDELLARIRAVSRRVGSSEDVPSVRFDSTLIDLANHRVRKDDGSDVRLTPTEWQLLSVLVRYPGKLITQRELLRAIRGPNFDDASHLLRQYMAQLRQKLEPNPSRPRYLLTEPGMGYRFQPDDHEPAEQH
jgi:two-component system, OmpR family, KDP operon response regulator KdpE